MSETLHLEGDLYIETFTNNVSNGVIGPVDVNSLEVKPDSEKISIPSKRKHKLGQARESYFVAKPATVNIKTSEIPPVLLAAAFMGLESPINQGAGTLTEVPVTLLAHPKWVSLGKTNLSEWAGFRDPAIPSGWSARGGQTKNPHQLTADPCGSSTGSGSGL